MKKLLLMFAAVAAIAFVGCKTETAQPADDQADSTATEVVADEQAPAEEQVTPAEPTVETVTADLMKLVDAKDEAGAVAFLDGLKKTAEDFLTAGDNNKYFNIINIVKTVWDANKDKILAALPALKDKIEAYITPKAELKEAFDAFIADPANNLANKVADKVEGAAQDVADAAANKAEEVKDAAKDAVAEGADAVKEAVK